RGVPDNDGRDLVLAHFQVVLRQVPIPLDRRRLSGELVPPAGVFALGFLSGPPVEQGLFKPVPPADLRAGNLPLPHVPVEGRQGQAEVLRSLSSGQHFPGTISSGGSASSRYGVPLLFHGTVFSGRKNPYRLKTAVPSGLLM